MKVGDGEKLHYYDGHRKAPEPTGHMKRIFGPTVPHPFTFCGRPGHDPMVTLPPVIEPERDVCASCRSVERARQSQRAQEAVI